MFAAKVLVILNEEVDKHREADAQEPREPRSNGRLREGVYRLNDAAAGEECPENGEPECAEDQPHVPDLQHAAFLLHHDRVQEGGTEKPRHERGVLDWVPAPISAPPEYRVGPVGPEKD